MSRRYEITRIETSNASGQTTLCLGIEGLANPIEAAKLAVLIGDSLTEIADKQDAAAVRAGALKQLAATMAQSRTDTDVSADPVGPSPSEAQQAAVAAAAAVAETTKKSRAKKAETPPPTLPPTNSEPPAQTGDFQQQVAAQAAPVTQPEAQAQPVPVQQQTAPVAPQAVPAQQGNPAVTPSPQQQTIDEVRKMTHDALEGGMDIESTRGLIKDWAETVPAERRVSPGALLMWVESIYGKANQAKPATVAPATDLLASVTSPTEPPPQQTPPPNMTFAQQVAQTIAAPPAGAADPNLVAAIVKILEDLSVNGPPTAARFASATRPLAAGGVSSAQIVGAISSNPALFAAYPQVSSPNALLSLPELLPILWGKV